MKKYILALNLVFFGLILSAQKNAINASQTVDHFTGAFTYSVPLISVPSPRGPSASLSAAYRSGVRTNQKSSIIGLGWNVSFGEITRQVNGFPDDYKGQSVDITEFVTTPFSNTNQLNSTTSENYYGPLYYNEFDLNDPNARMDVSTEIIQGTAANFPNYDNFYVNAPGVSGEIMAPLLEYASIVNEDIFGEYLDQQGNLQNGLLVNYLNINDSDGGCKSFTEKPVFNYLNSKSYSNNQSSYLHNVPDDLGKNKSWVTPPNASTNIKAQKGSKFIRYFTNSEIQGFDPSVSNNSLKEKGFLDFQIGGRNSNDYPSDGIGAFQVTNEHNYTYHFSLPVYIRKDITVNLKLNTSEVIESTAEGNRLVEMFTPYAVSWKLTAITGPNYEDTNENGIADEGDFGYWMAYDYGLLIPDYKYNIPDFGLNLSSNHNIDLDLITNRSNHSYMKRGSAKHIEVDKIYLTKISSATHYAKLYYDNAADGYGINNSSTPSLKLSDIALFSNETLEASLPSTGWQNNALQYVHLDQDYSLCKAYINNLNTSNSFDNNANSIGYINSGLFTYSDFELRNINSSSSSNNSGKLTLKGIKFYGKNNTEANPPYSFEYATNPNYDADKFDYFGFYKSDKTSTNERYVTANSAQMTHAWSLSKIGTPLGAEIEINYEPNEYSTVLNTGYSSPTRFFISNSPFLTPNVPLSNALDDDYGYFRTHPNLINEVAWGNPPNSNVYYNPVSEYIFSQIRLSKDYGGGSRVKNVVVKNDSEEFKTEFEYYEGVLTKAVGEFYGSAGSGMIQNIARFTKIDNESAKVGYGLVKSYNVGNNGNSDGTTLYKFSTLYRLFRSRSSSVKMKTVELTIDGDIEDSLPFPDEISNFFTKVKINEFGNLLQHQVFDKNDNIVEESIYTYLRSNTASSKIHYASNNRWEKSGKSISFDIPPMYRCDVNGEIMYFSPENKNLEALNEHYGTIISTTPSSGYIGPSFDENLQPYTSHDKDSIQRYYNVNTFGYVYEEAEDACVLFDPSYDITFHYPYAVTIDMQNVVKENKTFSYLYRIKHFKNGVWETKTIENYSGSSTRPFITEISDETGADLRIEAYKFNKSKFDAEFQDNLIDQDAITETYIQDELVSKVRNVRTTTANTRSFDPLPSTSTEVSLSDFVYKQEIWDLENGVWITAQESKLYNQNLNVLEQESHVDNYSAVKYGYGGLYPIASIANSRYEEFTYSGFEDVPNSNNYYESEVKSNSVRVQKVGTLVNPHTGDYMLEMLPSSSVEYKIESSAIKKKGHYRISIWCHKENFTDENYIEFLPRIDFNDGTTQQLQVDNKIVTKAGDWFQVKADVFIESSLPMDIDIVVTVLNSTSNTNNLYFDDFRFQPVDSEMSSTVYDKMTGQVLYVLDSENYYSRYEYDDVGSVVKIYKETLDGEILIQENSKHFKNF